MKNKKAISLMISYVILIAIAIGLSIAVFIWLKDIANVSPKIDCKEGTSLRLDDVTCSSNTLILTVKNNGNFNIDGFIIQASEDINRIPTKKLSSFEGGAPGYYEFSSPFKPSDNPREISFAKEGVIELIQIQPYVKDEKGKIVICEQAVIRQDTTECGLIPIDPLSILGIVSWWSFNGDADDENGINSGSCIGSACPSLTTDRNNDADSAYLFDGLDDYIEADVSESKNTIIFWYKNPSDTLWTFVANSGGTSYVNGDLGTPSENPVYINGNIIQIGKTSSSTYFNGKIDDVMIFDINLDATKIKELYERPYKKPYESPPAPTEYCPNGVCDSGLGEDFFTCPSDCLLETTVPNLISLWKFDEADGKIVGDSKGNNDGTHFGNTILMMRFENNANDESVYGNDGTLNGGIGFYNDAERGNVLNVNADNRYVSVPDDPSLRFSSSTNFSVELWIKTTDAGGWIIHNRNDPGTATNDYWDIELRSTGVIQPWFRNYGSDYTTTFVDGITPVNDGEWYHVVGVYDSSANKAIVYIDGNGEAEAIGDATGNFYENNLIKIGEYGAEWVDGLIDDVAIHSRALSQSEIQNHFIAGKSKFTDWTNDAKRGSVLEFDGVNDYAKIPYDNSLEPSEITISFWFNADTLSDTDTFVSKGDTDNIPSRYSIMFNAGMVRYTHVTDAGQTHGFNSQVGLVNTGEWNHVAFVYILGSATTAKIYINGQDANGIWDSGDGDIAPPSTIYDLIIGAGSYGTSSYFDGKIDDVAVFDRALTPGEILSLYCNQGGTAGC